MSKNMNTLTDAVVQSDNAKKSMKTSTVINVKSSVADAVANDPTTDVSFVDEVQPQAAPSFWQVFFSIEQAVTKYNQAAPCTIRAWLKALPFELLLSTVSAVAFAIIGLGLYFIHREYFSSNMYDAMWCGLLWYFFLMLNQHIGMMALRHPSADLAKPSILGSWFGNIIAAALYVLLSLAIGIGPFSGSGASASWAHLSWLQLVCTIASWWFATCAGKLSPALRRMHKQNGAQFLPVLMHTAWLATFCAISQIASVVVVYTLTYFSKSEQTLQNQAIEVLIVGVGYPCVRAMWRFYIGSYARSLYGRADVRPVEQMMTETEITSKQCFAMVGSVMTSLMLSWTSYVISLMSSAVIEIGSEIWTLRRQLRSHDKNPKTSLQDLLNMQAFRLSVSNEADQVAALNMPLMAGGLMEIVFRSTNPDAAFVGWYALLLRIPVGLMFVLVTDLLKTLLVYKYYNVNVLGVQRQRKIWNLVIMIFSPFTVPGVTLVGMCLAQ